MIIEKRDSSLPSQQILTVLSLNSICGSYYHCVTNHPKLSCKNSKHFITLTYSVGENSERRCRERLVCTPRCPGPPPGGSGFMTGVMTTRKLASLHIWRPMLADSWGLSGGHQLDHHTGVLHVAAWTFLPAGCWVSRANIPRGPGRSCITFSNRASDGVPSAEVENSPRGERVHGPHLSVGGESKSLDRKSTRVGNILMACFGN